MTLQPYNAAQVEQVALQVLDIACVLRKISHKISDDHELEFALHDRKAQEWIARLTEWARKSEAELEMALIRRRGARRAMKATDVDQKPAT